MTITRTFGRICGVLMLAASVSALSIATATPQELSELNRQILANPGDIELNLRYARLAEEQGELRHALAAYERVLINHPDNADARAGYTRIRRALEPAYTTTRAEFGARWDSNPLNVAGPADEGVTAFARAALVDERRLGARRWRSNLDFEAEITPEIDELNYVFIGAQMGPMMDVGPHVAAIPAIGLGASMLDGAFYYGDINASLTLEGRASSASWWTRLRAGFREYGDEATADHGPYAELAAGYVAPRVLSDNGSISVVPWVRWSDIEGSTFNFFFDEIAPGEYLEYGLDAAYNHRINDYLGLSVGALARERQFTTTTIFGEDREDTYVAPQASLMLRNVLPCNCTVKLTYRHRDNDSNDPSFDYDADQVSLSLLTRF